MASTFKTLVSSFINASVKMETLAAEMREHFADPTDRKFVRDECMPIVAEFYGITLVAKERGEGFTLPETHKSYKVAANKLSLMVNMIVGKTSGHAAPAAPVKVTRVQKAAAVEFLALFPSKAAAIAALKALK